MLTIEKLKGFGVNTDEGLSRCFGNEALYLRLSGTVPGEGNFQKLKDSIEKNDLDAAFEAAHALKGVLGNLSMTSLYDPVSDITELLRARTKMDYSGKLAVIMDKRAELEKLCNS